MGALIIMKRPVKPILGVIALVFAIVGLAVSIFAPDIAEAIQPSPPVEEKVADLTVRIKDAVVARLKDRDAVIAAPDRPHDWHVTIPKLAMGLGMLGLIGAAISYTRGEARAFAIAAAGLGVLALAWQAMMISLGALLLIVIVFAVLGALGIDLSF
jgi:hypothetical protein